MTPFLQKLAREIASKYGTDPSALCVVLPNRRAGLYLKTYLARELGRTSWAPVILSIEDFIMEISGYDRIDPTSLLFEFYAVHRELAGEQAQSFGEFAEWGQMLLGDFEEIDQYLADPDKIFTYLNEARALSVWNLGETPLTEQEKGYLQFYQSFLGYYQKLKERLLEKKTVYQGLAYRLTVENLDRIAAAPPWSEVYFAGLNALSTAEENLIDQLLRVGKARFYRDIDRYYVDDPMQEAGEFARKYLQKWPEEPVRWLESDFRDTRKEIRIFGVPLNAGQAQKAGELVKELMGEKNDLPDRTAVVLADENLLIPALYALPEQLGAVNVTMGYPFRFTHLYQLVSVCFSLQENMERFHALHTGRPRSFYVKDLLRLLGNPGLASWRDPGSRTGDSDILSATIRGTNRVFLTPGEIATLAGDRGEAFRNLVSVLATPWDTPADALKNIQSLLENLRDRLISIRNEQDEHHWMELEYLFHLSGILKRCLDLVETTGFIRTLRELRKVLFQLLDSARLPFYGEPLLGLQVMGVLETRAIDFTNLIVLSVNEGVLPSGKTAHSFIPHDIKLEFGLPTYQQKDAVFAYHFYRMLQRAEKVYLLYDTEGDQMKGGEKSRFIMQILHELQKYNPKITIEDDVLSPDPPIPGAAAGTTIRKNEAVFARLEEMAARGFSPTALNSYVRCSLQFYYRDILRLAEEETVEETIEAATMGNVVHEVLHRVYQPFTGTYTDPESLLKALEQTGAYLEQAFAKHYPAGDISHGKNLLIARVSHFLVNQLIRTEAELLSEQEDPDRHLEIIGLEQFLDASITANVQGKDRMVRIKGKADRIDRWGGTVRVIDYKTGMVRPDELKLEEWQELTDDPGKSKALQLLIYAWLFARKESSDIGPVETGNITLRRISEYFIPVRLPGDAAFSGETALLVENILKELLEDIFDPGLPFTQTEEPEHCEYCPFRALCNR